MIDDTKRALLGFAGVFGAGAVVRGAMDQNGDPQSVRSADGGDRREIILASDYITGDGVTNCDLGLARMHARVAERSAAGNTVLIAWPAGRYVFSIMPNWAITLLHISFQGEVWLINTGSGDTLPFDGGRTGAGVFGLRITGFPRLYGERGSRNGVFARSIYRSQFEISCRGAGQGHSGFLGEWIVSNEIRFSMNYNEGGLYSKPAQGMLLTARDQNSNFQSSYNSLYEPEFSGLPVGLLLASSLGNKIFGGAFQNNDLGLNILESAWANKVFATDFESNKKDLVDNGRTSQMFGCDFEKGPVFAERSRQASLFGGETNSVEILKGADRTLVSSIVYNRLGTGRILNLDKSTILRDARKFGSVDDVVGASDEIELTIPGSPYSYTNISDINQIVNISGGEVSRVLLISSKQISMPISGQYILRPKDTIRIYYSTVAPSVFVLPINI